MNQPSSNRRTALITGSGRNIGRGIALQLAQAGFNIVLNGSSNSAICETVANEIKQQNPDVNTLVAMGNIGDRQAVRDLANRVIDTFGSVDVLINNAAIRPNSSFLEVDEDEWERVMNINYKSVFWLARECLPGMVDKGWGRIVNFTGMNAQTGYPGKASVTVSKHAVWGLTKALAREFGPCGVTTNIISPGTIEADSTDPQDPRDFDALRQSNPTRRLGQPADIAALIALLVADNGGFINGQMLQVNGGVICQT